MLNVDLDSGWIGRQGEAICHEEIKTMKTIKNLESALIILCDAELALRFCGRNHEANIVASAYAYLFNQKIEAKKIAAL